MINNSTRYDTNDNDEYKEWMTETVLLTTASQIKNGSSSHETNFLICFAMTCLTLNTITQALTCGLEP